ncbi:MAG: CoB--CoM heterodisulfide reductase iron-sulfur subunit B family protein [Candidatus Cloacimonetes bacterium]|nr:CoB--CoM heterodisulfide reductase iron-sulfur subunit B family protein [Candidatus Cloacimonadota bacterium]
MQLPYYPGCTLKNHAKHFEDSAIAAMERLDMPLVEMEDWVCCGTVFSMSSDDLMLQVASIRNLVRAEHQNLSELIVLCSMCYNTLRRASDFILSDPENLDKVRKFMYLEEKPFDGTVEILHLLSVLRDRIGWEELGRKVVRPLANLKVGGYYGCLLVRPEKYAIDDFEAPTIIEDLLGALGATASPYPYRLECCGAYQTVTNKDVTVQRTYELLNSARNAGCEAIVTSCPLCAFNLDQRQRETIEQFPDFDPMPVFYFTELMALAFGANWDPEWTKLHFVNPEPILRDKGLI